MDRRSATPAPPTPPRRRSTGILAGLAILFVLQSGLMPFDLGTRTPSDGGGSFFEVRPYDLIVPDIVSNIALYFPVGALVCWTLSRRLRNGVVATLVTVIFAAFLSFGIEYAQAFSVSRVSSLIDVTGNVIGAALGASLSFVARWIIPRLTAAARLDLRERPTVAAVKGYCILLFIFGAIPFSFSFDLGHIKSALKQANLLPPSFAASAHADVDSLTVRSALGAVPASGPESAGGPANAAKGRKAAAPPLPYRAWFEARRWSRWAAEAASFFLLVGLLTPALYGHCRFSRIATVLLTLWLSLLLAGLLSLMQLFVVSRVCDLTDVLLRVAGAVLGLVCWPPVKKFRRQTSEQPTAGWRPEHHWRRLAMMACLASVIYILYTGVIPLKYAWNWDRVTQSVSAPAFMPFYAYFIGRFDLMLADFIEKIAAYGLLAALSVAAARRLSGRSFGARLTYALALCLPLSAAIEALQVFNPVRVASLTDPLVAWAGATMGVLVQGQAWQFYRSAIPVRSLEPAADRAGRPPALSPLDELVGTLAEPREDAPAEHEPSPPVSRPTTSE